MGASTMSDFALASNGRCFFCLSQILEVKQEHHVSSPLTPQTNSLQYLTRYLKMDLRKVFMDKGQVSPELLSKVEKARLKVELCEECRCLSKRFSNVYRQLEKLEMELGSTLSLIHGKLVDADATDKLRVLASGLNSNWKGSLEVLDVLRAEAIEKSSHKLSGTPRVKIQHLTKTEVKASQSMLKNHDKSLKMAHPGLQTSGVKLESPNEDRLSDNDNRNYMAEDANSNLDSESIINGSEEDECELNAVDNILPENSMFRNKKVVSRPTRNIVGPGKCTIDPKTGKRKCNDCQRQYTSASAFTYHYQTVHLKLRYKCVSCNKLFSNKSNLQMHQRTSRSCSITESAPKFKCQICEKSFSHKQGLERHLDGVHHKLWKHACDLCEKKFNTKNNLAAHKRKVHGVGKSNHK